MTALTANATRKTRNLDGKKIGTYTVATSSTIYQGALVAVRADGRALPATAANPRRFIGMAEEQATGNAAGTVTIDVSWGYEALYDAAAALTAAFLATNASVSDDNQVTTPADAGTAALQVLVGEVIQLEGGDAWVYLRTTTAES